MMKIPRQLRYQKDGHQERVGEDFLRTHSGSLVVLGEAGSGKTTLLAGLRDVPGYTYVTARKLINAPSLVACVGGSATIVVDALDEVPSARDGNVVDLMLQTLVSLGKPRFIASSRVADWRSATALEGIREIYGEAPIELHLEGVDEPSARGLLGARLGEERAKEVVGTLADLGLAGLWENPQTLELVAQVAAAGPLPSSRGDLFEKAVSMLWRDHSKTKQGAPLAEIPEGTILDAAGAALAALIVTGAEALSRCVHTAIGDLAVRDVVGLPRADCVPKVLDSRLFASPSADRFTYTHRAIGEFLGARWLAAAAKTPRIRRRLFKMLEIDGLVPASLRGLYGWLVWHDQDMAMEVARRDPMAIVEYGDASRLSSAAAREMLAALRVVARQNPRFREWRPYHVSGLCRPDLTPDLHDVLVSEREEPLLRLMVLEALRGSPVGRHLEAPLLKILLDRGEIYANRSEAGGRLRELCEERDWQSIVSQLVEKGDDGSVRLALDLLDDIGYSRFDDGTLVRVILAQEQRAEEFFGVFGALPRRLPVDRCAAVLDVLAAQKLLPASPGEDDWRRALCDLAYSLVSRVLANGPIDGVRLWRWLEPWPEPHGFMRQAYQELQRQLGERDEVRLRVQRHVLLEASGGGPLLARLFELSRRSPGLHVSDSDVVTLLSGLDDGDERWQDLVGIVRHSSTEGVAVRAAARRFVGGNAHAAAWLGELPEEKVPHWQVAEGRRAKERARKQAREWGEHRAFLAERVSTLRLGDASALARPAMAYLGCFHDVGSQDDSGPHRLAIWLGTDLRDACLEGFETYLGNGCPGCDAKATAVARAEGIGRGVELVLVAALMERFRNARGVDDVPDALLMAAMFRVYNLDIGGRSGGPGFADLLAQELRSRGRWRDVQVGYIQPQLELNVAHVDGLYSLMRDECDGPLAERLAYEWLKRYGDLAASVELELVGGLVGRAEGQTLLREIVQQRRDVASSSGERGMLWCAVGLVADFERTSAAIDEPIDPALLWSLRAVVVDGGRGRPRVSLRAEQMEWIVSTFRGVHRMTSRPSGASCGDDHPWDASDFLVAMINRLGDMATVDASEALRRLCDQAVDGYTRALLVSAAEQRRKHLEAKWSCPAIEDLNSVVADVAPTTCAQLREVILEELRVLQERLKSSDTDPARSFYDDQLRPREENWCRDRLLDLLRPMPFGIALNPESHLAGDERCDVNCVLRGMAVPIEIKGQWNTELWKAADRQLERYTRDWHAEGGIYLVLWFGRTHHPSKLLRGRSRGAKKPSSPRELEEALTLESREAQSGRVRVVVLDLASPEELESNGSFSPKVTRARKGERQPRVRRRGSGT